MSSFTYRDGQLVEVPNTIIAASCEVQEPVKNTLIIRSGANVTARSRISGTVIVENGAVLESHASVGGTVDILDGGQAFFHSTVGGTIRVREGGSATLRDTAVALGSMKVEGVLTNEGVRGVNVSGRGRVNDTSGATVRQPDETLSDGTKIYYS